MACFSAKSRKNILKQVSSGCIAGILIATLSPISAHAVTQKCKQSAAKCSVAELCLILGNGVFAKHYPDYFARAKQLNLSCLTQRSAQPRPKPVQSSPAEPQHPLKIAFQSYSEIDRKSIQRYLFSVGIYTGQVDGQYGAKTQMALVSYAGSNGFEGVNSIEKARIILSKIISAVSNASPGNAVVAEELVPYSSGTGFFVSYDGHVITNYHVVEHCRQVRVTLKGSEYVAQRVADDPVNDLSLLKFAIRPDHAFALSASNPYPLQGIVVVGFPFGEQISSTVKFTRGIISSIAGLENNFSQIQVDAAMQPGNSGGPIIDEAGNVVAVSVSKLALRQTVKNYGVVPENINFGIKTSSVLNLMEGSGIDSLPENGENKDPRDLARTATGGVVLLSCLTSRSDIAALRAE